MWLIRNSKGFLLSGCVSMSNCCSVSVGASVTGPSAHWSDQLPSAQLLSRHVGPELSPDQTISTVCAARTLLAVEHSLEGGHPTRGCNIKI